MDSTDWLMVAFITIWAIPGYIGAGWLTMKGYTLELIGCTILAGGLPILLPAVVGPILLLAAWILPHKHRKKKKPAPPARASSVQPPPAQPIVSRRCPQCGAPLRPGANFCGQCGAKQ